MTARKRLSEDAEELSLDMAPAKKPRKTAKPYVPQLRSGPYAILLALASISESEMVSKQQLIEMAQPHCDASFVAPKDATSYHTAWSSMKTLLNKDLVKETRGPQKRYELTDEGWEVAEKIKRVRKGEEGSGLDNGIGREEMSSDKVDNTTKVGQKSKARSDDKQKRKENTSGMNLPQVIIDIDDTGPSVGKGITRHRRPLDDRTNQNPSQPTRQPGKSLEGVVVDKYATLASVKISKPAQGSSATVLAGSGRNNTNTGLASDASAARSQAEERDRAIANNDIDFVELLSSSPPVAAPRIRSHKTTNFPNIDAPTAGGAFERARGLSSGSGNPPSCPSAITSTPPAFQPITLEPSTFTLELMLDNREVRSREDRTYIETELLHKHGIRPLIRSLPLGDFFWVAKLKDPNFLSRHGEEGDLIALDHIVERKRLDDLIASIKDGRFREQKFRLRRSGVANVVYLVEEIGLSQETKTKYWAAMQTAVASTQVIDGFTVKRTKGLDESIRYLARMTRLLRSIYEVPFPFPPFFFSLPPALSKILKLVFQPNPLHIIPSSILSPTTTTTTQQPKTTKQNLKITYPSFASLASKSDNRTLRDVFLHMLSGSCFSPPPLFYSPFTFFPPFPILSPKKKKKRLTKQKTKCQPNP